MDQMLIMGKTKKLNWSSEMNRVLAIVSNNIESGGVESYLINAYRNIDLQEFKRLDCNIITCNIKSGGVKRIMQLYKYIYSTIQNGKYDIMHVNTGNLTVEALAHVCARKAEIPIRIAHSHGTVYRAGKVQEMVRSILRKIINKNATHRLACSSTAAVALFGKEHIKDIFIVKNGIDISKYSYTEENRNLVRFENGWTNHFIIGSVGRLAPEKNYEFAIHILRCLISKMPNSKLVLIGDGEDKSKLMQTVNECGLNEYVEFLGIRNDVPRLLQGMDVFLLPSKREALGIVNIEAQATGLPC